MLKEIILKNIKSPTKADEIFKLCRSSGYDYYEIIAEIKQMVHDGELVELLYSLPGQHGDRLGILFPKGTEILKRFRD